MATDPGTGKHMVIIAGEAGVDRRSDLAASPLAYSSQRADVRMGACTDEAEIIYTYMYILTFL